MPDFSFPLDPTETLTIRRIFTFDRVPNKGKAVYRVYFTLRRFLMENGWEFMSWHRRNKVTIYMRAPMRADSFTYNIAVPNDRAILHVADAMIAHHAEDGRNRSGSYSGSLGGFDVTFQPNGSHMFDDPSNVISAEMRHLDHSPTFRISMAEVWGAYLRWLDGPDQPPTWEREEYFSALVPGLSFRGQLMSELEAIHAAEVKRYAALD